MNHALVTGAAGMAAQQAALDTVAADLANVDTPGFRAERPEFASFIDPDGGVVTAEVPLRRRLFTQGKLDATNSDHDLAIDGAGFFRVTASDGRQAFTRAGDFTPDANEHLRLPNGAVLDGIRLPRGTTSFTLSSAGVATASVAGQTKPMPAGRLKLWSFSDPAALELRPDGLFYACRASGKPQAGDPGTTGCGFVKQRCLERSNITIVAAMMAILASQRAYEANAKTVQAADEMLRLANNLERG